MTIELTINNPKPVPFAFCVERFGTPDGLGPLFVAVSCESCHVGDGKGHPLFDITRFGRPAGGIFDRIELVQDGRTLRFRDRDGEWRDAWDPTDPGLLPRAVEIVTHTDRHGMVRQVFAVGSGR